MTIELSPGLRYLPGYLDRAAQEDLLAAIRGVLAVSPLFRPTMPRSGKAFSVLMTNCGPLGWVSDRSGYRYQPLHPEAQRNWAEMPRGVLRAWHDLSGCDLEPEACLVNYYAVDTRMGLHQDRDEDDLAAPVLSLSLGDTAMFRFGGTARRDPTRSIKLESGDAIVLGGAARLAFHGIDRIQAGSSTLLPEGGRFNLTVRRVSAQSRDRS